MNADTTEDLRIGPEILKQQAELYRRLRNTLRWLLGSLAGWDEAERVAPAEMPELERWVLHRVAELDQRLRTALERHDWTGVYPDIHTFCAADLSAFYFDVRKDALYCDRTDSMRRRAARTVLDHLHRCLTAWLAPVLAFTAEEAWTARFGEAESVHLQAFPSIPADWLDPALGERMAGLREARGVITTALETARREGVIGSSLQAVVTLPDDLLDRMDAAAWAEFAIVSAVQGGGDVVVAKAPGEKCARCWRVLPEVGAVAAHPTLCLRCADAVESGQLCSTAA
jgi:isoleucyl-tRNA synthetase